MSERPTRILGSVLGTALVAGTLGLGLGASAAHAVPATPRGVVTAAVLDPATKVVTVRGWAYDPTNPKASIDVRVVVGGAFVGHAVARDVDTAVDAKYHIPGRHGYHFSFTPHGTVGKVGVATQGAAATGAFVSVGSLAVTTPAADKGPAIIGEARKYVGRARYRDGGSTPAQGFDCSGYTKWVYAQAKVATLPHSADGQRRMKGMHAVSAAHARPGDLVFYLSGGSSYHVAIYAGHHMQYAAATPRDGIRYQSIWSTNVVYGHYS